MREMKLSQTKPNAKMKNNSVFRSGHNQTETLASYEAADHAAIVLKSTSADGKWVAAHHEVEPEGEWFAIKKNGEIIASGSKSAVNQKMSKLGYKHDCYVAQDRYIRA
jgi:hypothetical protein